MALPMVALAKLGLIAATSHGLTPMVTALLWPFLLKFCFSFQPRQKTLNDVFISVRLFFFQMAQITTEPEPGGGGGGARWQRALRLVYERAVHARERQLVASRDKEESMLAVSMLVL